MQDAPPIFFSILWKRKRAVHGPKEKGAWRAPVQLPSARDGGRRIGASADLGWPSGTLWPSAKLILPSRGGWCGGQRGARTHLTSFSFRAFRFATRCPGGHGGVYHTGPKAFRVPVGADALIGPLQKPHQPPGQRQRKEKQDVSLTSPGRRFPQGQRVSVSDRRKGLPTIPRRRQEVCAGADRPAEAAFSFGPGAARFLFNKIEKKMGGASAQPSAWLHTPSRRCDSRPLTGPPIAPLPRNRLASSAAGGASAISRVQWDAP